jgi:hypothetical protein
MFGGVARITSSSDLLLADMETLMYSMGLQKTNEALAVHGSF